MMMMMMMILMLIIMITMIIVVRGEGIIFVIPFSMEVPYFLFIFFTLFPVFSLYIFLFYFLLSLLDFSFRWDSVLVRVKQAVRFYKVIIMKVKGEGSLYSGEGNYEKWIIIIGQAGFTTSPGRSDIGHAVNYDRWERGWSERDEMFTGWMVWNGWFQEYHVPE